MRKYVNREVVEEALFTKWEKERQHWIEYLKQYRATKEYSTKEQAVDNWLRGYGEAVEDFLAIMENTPAAEVVHDVTDTNVGGKWIPVTERLPEESKFVLCFYPEKNYGSKKVVDYREYHSDCFSEEFLFGRPSHWMPLPEPPETEKGGGEQ